MKKINILGLTLLIITLLSSCYKDEDVKGELYPSRYSLPTGNSDYEKYVRDFYEKYNTYILNVYKPEDYKWNLSTIQDIRLVKQEKLDTLNEGVKYMNKVWLKFYSDDFKKKFLPHKILVADSTIYNSIVNGAEDRFAIAGINQMAIGKFRFGIDKIKADSLNRIKAEINAVFWGNYLYNYEYINIPSSFFKISGEDNYNTNLRNNPENDGKTADEIDVKTYGFWTKEPASSKNYVMSPDEKADIYRFIYAITNNTKEEIEVLMDGYPKLKDKYNILVNHLKDELGVDIQAIGDAKFVDAD